MNIVVAVDSKTEMGLARRISRLIAKTKGARNVPVRIAGTMQYYYPETEVKR